MKKPWKPKLERTERVNEKPNLFATAWYLCQRQSIEGHRKQTPSMKGIMQATTDARLGFDLFKGTSGFIFHFSCDEASACLAGRQYPK